MTVKNKLFDYLPAVDFTVLTHGFRPYNRDYQITVQISGQGGKVGIHECLFTHCVFASTETRVADEIWLNSWSDNFINYEIWKQVGEPSGFVWGTNWSLAYPGLSYVQDSILAAQWSKKLRQSMHEITIETDAMLIRLVFHEVRFEQISSDSDQTGKIIPSLARAGEF